MGAIVNGRLFKATVVVEDLEAHERHLAVQLARYRTRDFSDPKYATTRKALADIKKLERKHVGGRRQMLPY